MATLRVERYTAMVGPALKRLGRTPITGSGRDDLVYGLGHEPDADTTGLLPGWTTDMLTEWNSPTTNVVVNLVAGTTYENLIMYGTLRHPGGADIVIRNCWLRGRDGIPTSASGVVDVTNERSTGKIFLYDNRIEPRHTANTDCVVGHKYEAYRNHLVGGVDGFGTFRQASVGGVVDAKMMGNFIDYRSYVFPDYENGSSGDTWHEDGTHNDGWQHQGGTGVHFKGNRVRGKALPHPGTGMNPDKPWLLYENNGIGALRSPFGWANGSGIIVQVNGTLGSVNKTVIVEENFISGFLAHLNVKPNMSFIYRNNRHYREAAVNPNPPPTWNGYWIRFDLRAGVDVEGLTDTNTNRWIDGPYAGDLLTEPRTNGIEYNA